MKKTTLNIGDTVMRQLKREAARQKRTMSDLVETALRNLFQKQTVELSPFPASTVAARSLISPTGTRFTRLWKADEPAAASFANKKGGLRRPLPIATE